MQAHFLDWLLALLVSLYPLAALLRVRWSVAIGMAGLALAAGLGSATLQWLTDLAPGRWFSPHPASPVVALIVTFIGFLVLRFSRNYLAGEPRLGVFQRRVLWLLGGVVLVVTTNHALMLLAGWVGISLALHSLLLFYPERPRAQLAAHKKFLLARLAELSLAIALLLLYLHHGSPWLSDIFSTADALSLQQQVAIILIAVAALIKCAQLPVHGWLIQVVEAPTPVSALLHAGVINLGGYLLILAAPLLAVSAAAQWLVLVVAGLTVVVATLAMCLQTSVKERLAWSTSAQMGLMLLECALGLHALALLHLAAHSCYKAHGFLAAADNMNKVLAQKLAGPPRWRYRVLPVLALSLGLWLLGVTPVALALLALTLVMVGPLGGLLIAVAYLAQKTLFETLLPSPFAPSWPETLWVCVIALLLLAGFMAQGDPKRVRFRHWLHAGLFLDHWATRLTLAVWPAPIEQLALLSAAKRNKESWS
ncbi:NADH-quinone oxidoreductase subunit L [Microbulbifer aggregans]|uniref:Probable inorganic carbon transporter subunit DabB n=1 Tax=Microbulbifer aggregans TaxID=1769779 RepID=A0A1C9WB82_9GAMM|nr:NADH-quinone oxidoreductase subunit L [Microbulbifer aggregans]AOS98405.1 NADH-quinone oxidoreductase subunit L [Microbulbifer aggregans]